MRPEPNLILEPYRKAHPTLGPTPPGTNYGYFVIDGWNVISSGSPDGLGRDMGWEHISVSRPNRTPDWAAMQRIKELFWGDNETVVQFHPRKDKYVNFHPHVLHMWRRVDVEFELPPRELI